MSLDYSAVPRMPDGHTAAEYIDSIAALSQAVRVPMGNGGRMMWHVFGADQSNKPILLLFHGGSGSWIHWIRNVVPLSQHFAVYAADLPGLGDSDPPDDVRDIWSVTRCVKTAMDALIPRDRDFAITGFSFGGMVSGHVATLAGDRLRRLVLVGAGGLKATRKPGPKLRKLLPDSQVEQIMDGVRGPAGGQGGRELGEAHDLGALFGEWFSGKADDFQGADDAPRILPVDARKRRRIAFGRDHATEHVPLGEDAHQPRAIHDQHGAKAVVAHDVRSVEHR